MYMVTSVPCSMVSSATVSYYKGVSVARQARMGGRPPLAAAFREQRERPVCDATIRLEQFSAAHLFRDRRLDATQHRLSIHRIGSHESRRNTSINVALSRLRSAAPDCYREETESMGTINVAADKVWGAQTQRSLEYFGIGYDIVPHEVIATYGILKKAAGNANSAAGSRLTFPLRECSQ